jgi:hypothetical protein
VVVLDTCHSGTGLRDLAGVPQRVSRTGHALRGAEIDLPCSLARAGAQPRLPQARAVQHEVRSRFAAPPPEVESDAKRRGQPKPKRELKRAVARAGGATHTRAMLVAACRPEQTAADAFFPRRGLGLKRKGVYQGALTAALCDAWRAEPGIAPGALGKRLTEAMKAGNFGQIPQVEVA